MKVGDKEEESRIVTSTTGSMGATNEIPTSLAPSSTSPPLCSRVPLVPTEHQEESSKVFVCVPSNVLSTSQTTPLSEALQMEAISISREESTTSQINTKDSTLYSSLTEKKPLPILSKPNDKILEPEIVTSSTLLKKPDVLVGAQSCGAHVISSTIQAHSLIYSSPQFPLASSSSSSSFQGSPSISSNDDRSKTHPSFLCKPPVPPLSRLPLSYSSRSPLIQSFPMSKNAGSNPFTFSGGRPLNGNSFQNIKPCNVPQSNHSYLVSSMRPPVCGPGQPLYATAGPGGITSSFRAPAILPGHSTSGSIASHLHDSQSRSYSFPRGPSPPSIPLGFGRNHSWPSETSGHSISLLRPPIASSSLAPPPFLSSSFTQGPLQRGSVRPPQTLRISKWVNPIPPDPDDGQQQTGEQELATKMLQIQSKRFYIDVKQNRRGRFMKVAEIGADGRRNQVFLALSTAAEFRDHLSMFSEFYSNLGPPNPDTLPEDGKLKSETMVKDNRRYYLDLKENSRGRFLRVSQTIARGGPRCQIAIPAQGMIEFRDALQELLEEFGTDDGGFKGELPEGRHMRVENKNFYFDIGQNNRGIYMRISEVKTNFRTAITIPEKSWSRFRDIFADYVDKMKEGGEKNSSESNK